MSLGKDCCCCCWDGRVHGFHSHLTTQQLALLEPGDTRILLDLRRREITVVRAGQSLGAWHVAIGDPQMPTPKGNFFIFSKQINPLYFSIKGGKPRKLVGPSSPIGDRYLGFHHGEFGIHGTP